MNRWIGFLMCIFLAVAGMPLQSHAEAEQGLVVGRIYHIEGDLMRYIPDEKDWVAVVEDAPFGVEDTLYSGIDGRAELIVPNGTLIRTGDNTQIQFIALDPDLTEVDVAIGIGRFYNKGNDTVVKVTSPFGDVIAYPGAVFDFYVGDNSVEVVAVRGKVSFVHAATDARYDVSAGSPSILADEKQVSSGEETVDPDWDRWNANREGFWASKKRVRGRSMEYLPESLRDDSYALEENGRWERVPYEGRNRWFWRPTIVVSGWSPFTVGRWTNWYGDQIWIPAEPFGYITHHYGNWVYVRNNWYWAPPVVGFRVGLPLLDIGFFWSPGRVSWIHTGAYVGWVPLAPRETYYSHRHWGGPNVVVVNNINITRININVRDYAYASHAVVVNQDNFYRVNNYRDVRVTDVNRAAIINDYRAAPVVNDTVIKNYTTIKQRNNYTNAKVNEKPHNTAINRIEKNKTIIHESRKEKASMIHERVKSIPEGKVNREARIELPKTTNNIVPAGEVNRPKPEIKLQQKEIKSHRERTAGALPEVVANPDQQPGKPEARPERMAPAKPDRQKQPGSPVRPERVRPAKPAQTAKPEARLEEVAPAKVNQQKQPEPPVRPERVRPAKPDQPVKPEAQPDQVAPAKVYQQKQPDPLLRPEQVRPAKPGKGKQFDQYEKKEKFSEEKSNAR